MSTKSKKEVEVEVEVEVEEVPVDDSKLKDEIRDVQGVQPAQDGTLTDDLDALSAADLLLLAVRATTPEAHDDYMERRLRRI